MKYIITLVMTFILVGCSTSMVNEQPTKAEQSKTINKVLNNSQNVFLKDKIKQKHIKQNYIYAYPNEKVSTVLKKLGTLENRYYYLRGKDIEITGNRNFKIHTFQELNSYIKTLTNYELEIKINEFRKDLPKIVTIIEQKQASNLDNIVFSSNGIQIPSHIFSQLSNYAKGWRVVDYADIKTLFNKKQYTTFSGSLRDFIEYFAQNNDIFVDFNYNKKKIIFKKYKTKHFPIKIVLEKYKFKNNLMVDIDEPSDNSTGDSGGKVEIKSEYDALTSLTSLLNKIIKKTDEKEYWNFLTTTNKLVIKTTPRKLKTIENVVNNINEIALKQIFMKVSVYEIALNRESQFGIDWGYVNDIVDSAGVVTKTTIGSTSSIVGTVDKALTSPSIFKMSGEGFNTAIKLLNEFGDTSLSNQMPLITTNNIPSIYSLADRTGYISDYTLETTANVGSNIAIEQAKAISGQYVYMKPTIFNDEILISLKMILSRVKDIEKQEFSNGQYIQTPNDTKNVISQNIVIQNGEKIVIGGIIEKIAGDGYKGLSPYNSDFSALLGEKNKLLKNKEVVIVIEAKQL